MQLKLRTLKSPRNFEIERRNVCHGAVALFTDFLAAQCAMQDAAGALFGIDAQINGFVAHARLPVGLEKAADLLRAPQLGELGLGLLGPVTALTAVAPQVAPNDGFGRFIDRTISL